jgi:hypothetical protein
MKIGNQGEGGGRPPIVFDEHQIKMVESLASVLSKKTVSGLFCYIGDYFEGNRS